MSREVRFQNYYTELKKFIESANFLKAIKSCNKIISEEVTEVEAWHCKIIAYIQLTQFRDALDAIKKSGFSKEFAFEKAYCLYRMNDTAGAWGAISEADSTSHKVKELKAQILYRLERFSECYDLYKDLIRTTSDEFEQERHTNMLAVVANKAILGHGGVEHTVSDDSYEILYNSGCYLLASGRLGEALNQMKAAESKCLQSLQDEGASEEEINEEVAIIRVQQGHCHHLLGNTHEAMSIYDAVLKTKPEDPALLAVINNNIVAINRGTNIFDSKKRIKFALAPGLEHKLTSRQRSSVSLNNCLLAFHANQDETCRLEIQKLKQAYPELGIFAALIESCLDGRSGRIAEATSLLHSSVEKDKGERNLLVLSLVQLLLNKGDIKGAAEELCSLEPREKFRPGVVSLLVSLYTACNDKGSASVVLRDAVDWHKKAKTSGGLLSALWHHAADFHLCNGDAAVAAASLQELHKLDPSNLWTLSQLITAYSQFDLDAAKSMSTSLPPILDSSVDVDALESSFGPKYAKKMVTGKGADGSPASPKAAAVSPEAEAKKSSAKKKKKKKRKTHLPKNYVEGVPPDPERWLPRWQRKGYKKKKDRRHKDVMKGTQGTSSDAADKFDITKTAGQHRPVQQPAVQESSGPRRNPKKKQGNKKRKGGWQ